MTQKLLPKPSLSYDRLEYLAQTNALLQTPSRRNKYRRDVYRNLKDLRELTDQENRIAAWQHEAPPVDAFGQYSLFEMNNRLSPQVRQDPVYHHFLITENNTGIQRLSERNISKEGYWHSYKHTPTSPRPEKLLGITHADYSREDLIGGEQ